MSLPTLSLPKFDLTIPSTKKKISLRPYTVKEQSLLLMAASSDDLEEISNIVKQILTNCVLTPNFNIQTLTLFDIQYIFLRLRARSVGEVVSVSYKCKNEVGEKECGHINTFDINLLEIEVSFPEKSKLEIQLNHEIGIKLKYPSLESTKIIEKYGMINSAESLIDILVHDTEYVYDSQKIYDSFTPEELKVFVGNFGISEANKLFEFYSNLPSLSYTLKYKCQKCGYQEDIVINDLNSFLD